MMRRFWLLWFAIGAAFAAGLGAAWVTGDGTLFERIFVTVLIVPCILVMFSLALVSYTVNKRDWLEWQEQIKRTQEREREIRREQDEAWRAYRDGK